MTPSRYDPVHTCIDVFVADLEQLVRQAALESVQQALGGQPGSKVLERWSPQGRPSVGAARASGKRTAKELEALSEMLLKFIEKHPGSRMEQIAEGMGISSRELTLPLRYLKEEGHIKTKGQKRATAYFAK